MSLIHQKKISDVLFENNPISISDANDLIKALNLKLLYSDTQENFIQHIYRDETKENTIISTQLFNNKIETKTETENKPAKLNNELSNKLNILVGHVKEELSGLLYRIQLKVTKDKIYFDFTPKHKQFIICITIDAEELTTITCDDDYAQLAKLIYYEYSVENYERMNDMYE